MAGLALGFHAVWRISDSTVPGLSGSHGKPGREEKDGDNAKNCRPEAEWIGIRSTGQWEPLRRQSGQRPTAERDHASRGCIEGRPLERAGPVGVIRWLRSRVD